MKKLILIGVSGATLLVPSTAFAYSRTVTINNQSTLENVVLWEYGGSGDWCFSGTLTGNVCTSTPTNGKTHAPNGSGPWATFSVPPQTSAQMKWTQSDAYMDRFVSLASNVKNYPGLTPAQNDATMKIYCNFDGHEYDDLCVNGVSGSTGTDWNSYPVPPTAGFKYNISATEEIITYASSTCPSISEATYMLKSSFEAMGSCPTSYYIQLAYPDSLGRQWSAACSKDVPNSNFDPLTTFEKAYIDASISTNDHFGRIFCKYTNPEKHFDVTFMNKSYGVIPPIDGNGSWSRPSESENRATCSASSESSTNQCQWLYTVGAH